MVLLEESQAGLSIVFIRLSLLRFSPHTRPHHDLKEAPMLIRFIKQSHTHNSMECIRLDGSVTRCSFPNQGTVPRALIQFVVEDTLNIRQGIFGAIAAGKEIPVEDGTMHPHQTHPHQADTESFLDQIEQIETLQIEALIQCFQTEMIDAHWREYPEGTVDPLSVARSHSDVSDDRFQKLLTLACQQRQVDRPDFLESQIQRVRSRLRTFSHQWNELPVDASIELRWATTTLWLGGEDDEPDAPSFIAAP